MGKINEVYKGLLIIKIYDAYTFILKSLSKMSISGTKDIVYIIFSDKFMTTSILDSMGMKNISIFYYCYHLKLNLRKSYYPNGRYYNYLLHWFLE